MLLDLAVKEGESHLFIPSLQSAIANVSTRMRKHKVDETEMIALYGVALFDPGVNELSSEARDKMLTARGLISKSLLQRYEDDDVDDPEIRLGTLYIDVYTYSKQLSTEPPTGIVVNKDAASADLKQLRVDVTGAAGTSYEGEKFSLQFRFTQQYPVNSPEVMYVGENIPVHPHVYSNGHICLSILSEDWTPAMSVQTVCLSILSMLSSAREKKRPPDNASSRML
ncbi:hypothetical protein RB195_003107 [Necator americanus]|uniref:UBC core domain-containing protein n=1 Tax=Necator americanus TaxID=51031 RepID=A0ABR1DM93_NECAM